MLMQRIGLKDILEAVYGENAVAHNRKLIQGPPISRRHQDDPFKILFSDAALMISAVFQYKGWSSIRVGGRLYLIAKLQRNSNVDRMQILFPKYPIMGKYTIEGCPGFWLLPMENLRHAWPIRVCLVVRKQQLPQDIYLFFHYPG